jgi:hypothetical protein
LSNRVVTDTASGMRVIRRDVLERLYPLPDGLHFTPAMSARVLCDEHLDIVECPMAYAERIGESKLQVFRDGMRFLRTIFEMTLMWQPARLFVAGAFACLLGMVVLAAHPLETWTRVGRLQEDTIYRLLFCSLLGSVGFLLLSAGVICEHLHRLWSDGVRPRSFFSHLLDRAFTFEATGLLLIPALPAVGLLVGPGLWTRVFEGYVAIHWSRVVVAGLIVFSLAQVIVTVLIVNLIRFHTARGSRNASASRRMVGSAEGPLETTSRRSVPRNRVPSLSTCEPAVTDAAGVLRADP